MESLLISWLVIHVGGFTSLGRYPFATKILYTNSGIPRMTTLDTHENPSIC